MKLTRKGLSNTMTKTDKVDQIENNFKHHPPKGDQAERYGSIRHDAKQLAHLIDNNCPNGREKSLAMTKLEEAVFWANASIARNE